MPSDDSDHYATLGLDRRCTLAQIRSAFRLLAKRHHPDANAGASEAAGRFREINEAHEVLSDPARRRAYDADLEDQPAPPPRAKLERNIAQDAHLRIEEFLRGTTLQIRVNDPANPNGPESFTLEVPPDTAPGTRFRLPREEPFEGGFVQVRVKALPGFRFKVRGSDLRCDLRIKTELAAKGGSETIPGPTGAPLRVPIAAGIGRGEVVRIAGQGMPKPRGGRGELLVRITYRPEVRVLRSKA